MDVVGRTIVLHEMPGMTSRPSRPRDSGNDRLHAGEIKAWEQECKNKNGNE